MRISNDKYYTSVEVANKCWNYVIDSIGKENISEIIEPSVGNGAFLNFDITPNKVYDIEPECEDICKEKGIELIKGNYLCEEIEYKSGRLIIGNPPYGIHMSLAQKFYKKSCSIGDYVAFILPISQLNNTQSLFEFNLVQSIDLGLQNYTDRELHCCFNIYQRPTNGKLNKKEVSKLRDITIYRQDRKDYNNITFDIRLCYWGNGCAGKILKDDEHYSAEYKIKINNEELREEIIKCLETFDWKAYLNCIAARKIHQFHIVEVLRNNVKGIK